MEGNDSLKSNLQTNYIGRAFGRANVFKITPLFKHNAVIKTRRPHHFAPHTHYSYEVIIVKKGSYSGRLNEHPIKLNPFQGIVVKPGDLHEDFCGVPLTYFALSFDLIGSTLTSPEFFSDHVKPHQQCFEMKSSTVLPLLKRLQQEDNSPDLLTVHVQDAILMELFWYLVRALSVNVLSESISDLFHQNSFVNQLLMVFQENLNRQLSLSEIAEMMGISESSLSHKSRQLLGMSAAKAFMKCKMEHALELLRNTSKLVKEIAFLTGFQDPYTFSKAFKKYFGLSPSFYREKND